LKKSKKKFSKKT